MDYALGWNRFNLELLGVWPEPSKGTLLRRITSASIFWTSTTVIFLFICAPQTTDLILNSTTLDEAIENLSINIPIAFALIKQIVLRYHGEALRLLLVEIVNDWTQTSPGPERLTMLKNAKISRRISLSCSTLAYTMLIAFVSLQTYASITSASEVDLGGLLHPATFPYDTKKSPYFEITWMGQFIGSILTGISYSCFDTFFAVFVLHLCGQLSSMGSQEKDLPIVGIIFFFIHVIYALLHLYISCYVGETLLVESTGIAFSAYDCAWYDLPPKKAMCLMIIICRARVAFQITAGKFSPLSLELFGSIMKTSAGYLSVLLAVKEDPVED
ncbi:hypothetical protein HZH66_004401 [Vespula vulgaris]|uniref:Odorant receptor n=1 Tax=Vespula vulgaris TaxID=7454 RepID=A0A834NCZ9_VESVU|nr:hypothetical protein HZH66_004401 [Vespula vulgaris]